MAKDYQTYHMFDFITDESFKSWVLEPNAESNYFWQSWIDSHPEQSGEVAKAREFILSVKFKTGENRSKNKEAIYEMVMQRSKRSIDKPFTLKISRGIGLSLLKVAASIILILSIAFLVKHTLDRSNVAPTQVTNSGFETKTTRKGEKLTVMLPDGTTVKLNAESTLKYPVNFGETREVHLTGEAFFEVAHDSLKPFVVETSHLLTTALGTSFNVNAYPDFQEEVTLITGKVRINNSGREDQSEILLPGEKVEFKDGLLKKSTNVSMDHVRWKDGVIVFHKTPFNEGILELERWYGVSIDVKDIPNDPNMTFTAIFEHDNLSNVLKTLSYALRFDFQIEGKKVLITFK